VLAELRRRGLLGSERSDPIARVHSPCARLPKEDKRQRIAWARTIWSEAREARGTIADAYLRSRGLILPADAWCIRYHPQCARGSERMPAIVAEMRSATTDEFLGVHRTFIKPDGSGKAEVEPQRMALGSVAGAVVKVSSDEDVSLGLGICEGIEDALAIIGGGWRPVWSCMSAGGISTFPVLGGVEALTVFADADRPGLLAAQRAVERWQEAGRQARIVVPKNAKDFDEALR
jgi:hypothetical protein